MPKKAKSHFKWLFRKTIVTKAKAKAKAKSKPALSNIQNMFMMKETPFLPIKRFAWMPYHEVIAISSGGTPETATCVIWSLNGLFDPEVPVGGHQPMGFDQAMTFYEHYLVLKAKWTIQVYCNKETATAVDTPLAVGYYISSTGTAITGSDRIVENGLMKRKIAISSVNNSRDIVTLSGTIDLPKFFGKKIINEDDYRGNSTVNPVEQAYIVFFVNNLEGTANITTTWDITFDYYSVFTEPKKQVQS